MQAAADASSLSLIRPLGYQRKDTCGYCKTKAGSSSYFISSTNLRVEHYQELVDRGWRRSGQLYYKTDLSRSCCPHYTIRLDASAFSPKKGQRQAINRWNRYILGADYMRKAARLCPKSRDEKRKQRGKFDLTTAVHASEYSHIRRPVDPATKKPIEPAHKFEITLEPDGFSTSKWNVFLPYQMEVHKEPKSQWSHQSFKRFLCSGIDRKIVKADGKSHKLGSYHQCYRLDGKLIAVGVLDLLPHGVSAVYFFYDPEFNDWELGKISALREIALAWEGQYQYYYMGFYIHSCIKMRYKGAYSPTYILDPESLEWDAFDEEYRRKLDLSPYVSLSRDRTLADGHSLANAINGVKADPLAEQRTAEEPYAESIDPSQNKSATPKRIDETEYELDSEPPDSDVEIPDGSLFDYKVPGILKKEEVEQLDLDHWKLLIRNTLVDMEDLVGWDEAKITDPHSLRGIAGELAAAIGSAVMSESAVILF